MILFDEIELSIHVIAMNLLIVCGYNHIILYCQNPTRFTHRCHKLVDHLIEKHESVMKESFVRRLDRCVNVDRKLSIHCD